MRAMDAFLPERWADFFVAETGAAAALAGLVIVAISINLKAIVEVRLLSGRALETVVMLGTVLLISSLALVPGQPLGALGWEMLALGLGAGLVHAAILVRARHFHNRQEARWLRILFALLSALPVMLAGLSLLGGPDGDLQGGLYWLVPAVAFGLIGGLVNSWVLLVEILR
jgi:modulator of FtsH protease